MSHHVAIRVQYKGGLCGVQPRHRRMWRGRETHRISHQLFVNICSRPCWCAPGCAPPWIGCPFWFLEKQLWYFGCNGPRLFVERFCFLEWTLCMRVLICEGGDRREGGNQILDLEGWKWRWQCDEDAPPFFVVDIRKVNIIWLHFAITLGST